MSIERHHGRLLVALLAVVGVAPVCAVTAAGCGGSTESGASGLGGDGGPESSLTQCNSPLVQYVEQRPARLCGAGATDAGEAGDANDDGGNGDAGAPAADGDGGDAGDAGDVDAAVCFVTCADACRALVPSYSLGSAPTCMAGSGALEGTVTCTFSYRHPCGRGFAELLAPPASTSGSKLGAFFAEAAWMEAASITAFRRLGRELVAHGAPGELVRAAREAARDEIRHARAMARLARRFGAEVPRVEHVRFEVRSLEELAIENAREACVGETYGAVLAAWQARHARDGEIRLVMAAIAGDELRHAALGHAIGDWVGTKLEAAARARVAAATRDAVAVLARRAVGEDVPHDVVSGAGMPAARDALRMVAAVSAMAA